MPMYTWQDKVSSTVVTVVRAFSEYENPPEEEEIPEAIRGQEHEWERLIGADIAVVKGNGWGSGKGYW